MLYYGTCVEGGARTCYMRVGLVVLHEGGDRMCYLRAGLVPESSMNFVLLDS